MGQLNNNMQTIYKKAIRTVSGRFNGVIMAGTDGSSYPVNPNYASKRRLVEGDYLKLTILEDGLLMYKLISSVPKERVIGVYLGMNEVNVDYKVYKLLEASVSYFRPQPGDKLSLIVPKSELATYAALDAIAAQNEIVGQRVDVGEIDENLKNLR